MDPLSRTDVIQTESLENFVVIFEKILPIDKDWRATKLLIADLWRVVALTSGMLLFKLTFFPHRSHFSRTLQLCFVSPNWIRIQFLFHSHSDIGYLNYCLLVSQAMLIDVVRRSSPSRVSSPSLLVSFSIKWLTSISSIIHKPPSSLSVLGEWLQFSGLDSFVYLSFSSSEGQCTDTGSQGRAVLAQKTSRSFGAVRKAEWW